MDGLYLRSIAIDEHLDLDTYPGNIPVIRQIAKEGLSFERPLTIFIGENGSGKSTVLEAIAIAMGFNPEGGTRNFLFSTNDSHSPLHEHLTTIKGLHPKDGFFLRAESFYNLASNIDEMDRQLNFGRPLIDSYGGVSLHKRSHGESFLDLVKNRFGGKGFYLLDEPEAALSPSRLMQLAVLIHDLIAKDSQFIICTHSPILMSYPNADLREFSEEGIRKTSFQETEHYRITRDFIEKPEVMYSHLFN